MPRVNKPWIFTKAKEFEEGKTLQLGQILADPKNPAHVLMPGGPLPVPKELIQESSFQTSVDIESKDDLVAMFGLWTTVAGQPAGGKAGGSVTRSDEISWHFEKLTGKIVSPSVEYVKSSLLHGDVPSYTSRLHLTKRLWMITGVRVAHGGRMTKKNSRSVGVDAKVHVDATTTMPLEAGASAHLEKSKEDKESFKKASDFVYAYRLSEISYWGEPRHEPYVKGEVAGGTGVEGSDSEEEVELEPCVGGMKADFNGYGFNGVEIFSLPSVRDAEVDYQCLVIETY